MPPGRWRSSQSFLDPEPLRRLLKKWAKNYWDAIYPFDLGGAYPNFMMDDEGEARIKEDLRRQLADVSLKLKNRYDPGQPIPGEPELLRPAA